MRGPTGTRARDVYTPQYFYGNREKMAMRGKRGGSLGSGNTSQQVLSADKSHLWIYR